MLQQVLVRGQVPEACPDRYSTASWMHDPEVHSLTKIHSYSSMQHGTRVLLLLALPKPECPLSDGGAALRQLAAHAAVWCDGAPTSIAS